MIYDNAIVISFFVCASVSACSLKKKKNAENKHDTSKAKIKIKNLFGEKISIYFSSFKHRLFSNHHSLNKNQNLKLFRT